MRAIAKASLTLGLAAWLSGLSGGAPTSVVAGPVCPMPVGASCDSHWTDPGGEGGGRGNPGAMALPAALAAAPTDEIEDLPLPPRPRGTKGPGDCDIPPGEGDSHWTGDCD